jgi:3-oxoacyl-[acyl-carrier-protein] synthase-3
VVPEKRIANADLAWFPKAAIPLIQQKTGIEARHHVEAGTCTSDLAAAAAEKCLSKAAIVAEALDAVIVATSSPDRAHPPTAARVQRLIGARRAFALDLNAVCAGGVFALHTADALIRAGFCKRILVIAAEVYSPFLNPRDFATFPYFGDGAGAALLAADTGTGLKLVGSILHSDGNGSELIQVPAGGSMMPGPVTSDPAKFYFTMKGREVFEFATEKGPAVILELLERYGLNLRDITAFITHQANLRIIEAIAARLNVPAERFFTNLQEYGNTASASILIALDEFLAAAPAEDDAKIVLVAFGGGLSWGATLICKSAGATYGDIS